MNVKLTKAELQSVNAIFTQFDEVQDFTIVRGPTQTGTQSLEIVFETTVKGFRGLFKIDLTETN